MNISDLKRNDTVNFETVLGERRVNYRYVGSVDWTVAQSLGLDVIAKHRQYSIETPEGSPLDYRNYSYAIFRDTEGVNDIYGHPWLVESSIQLRDQVSYVMRIPNASEQQLSSLRSMATAIGIMGFTIEPQE